MSNIAYFMILLPTIFFIYIVSICAQYSGRGNCFYGVKVDELALGKEDKIKITNQYKKSIRIISLIMILSSILAAYNLGDNFETVMNFIVFIYAGFILLFQFRTHNKVKKSKNKLIKNIVNEEGIAQNKAKILDTCLLNEKLKIQNKFRVIFLILLFISSASILHLVLTYNELPKLIPTDFAGDSTPINFVVKNLKTVFKTEILGFIMISLLGFIAVSSIGNITAIREDKLENSGKQVLKYINKIGNSFVLIGLCIELQTTILPIILFNQYKFPVYTIIFAWFLIAVSLINILYSYIMLSSFKIKEKFDYRNDDSKWIFGYFYFNKDDPSFIVERKVGIGYTVNLAHQKIKVLLATVLLFFIINMTLNIG